MVDGLLEGTIAAKDTLYLSPQGYERGSPFGLCPRNEPVSPGDLAGLERRVTGVFFARAKTRPKMVRLTVFVPEEVAQEVTNTVGKFSCTRLSADRLRRIG